VLIVTGLVQEARIAAGPGMIVICSSSDPRQLRALLATLDSSTFRGVISFGVAGGLDPSRSPRRGRGDEVFAGDAERDDALNVDESASRAARAIAGIAGAADHDHAGPSAMRASCTRPVTIRPAAADQFDCRQRVLPCPQLHIRPYHPAVWCSLDFDTAPTAQSGKNFE